MVPTGTTMAIELERAAFLLERLAADCAPLQSYRELTKNALEALGRVLANGGGAAQVVWDVEWHALSAQVEAGQTPVYKLAIWDTGDGMTGEEMLRYINHLSSSSGVQALDANFGVGAKITAGVSNPIGLVYTSLKNDEVHQIHFWRDPVTKVYGAKPFETPNGDFVHWRKLRKDVLPDEIIAAGHGTMVTLLGHSDDENTLKPPSDAVGGVRWLVRYLNRRFFRYPENVSVRVREFSSNAVEKWPTEPTMYARQGGILRPAHGQAHYLGKNAEASGTVKLTDGTAHWWLLKDEKLVGDRSYWLSTGHVAALFQEELYELRDGNAGTRQLMHFGVLFGSRRVVIYVEPDDSLHLTPNTARSQLLVNGESLPWDQWAAEFRAKLPEPIQQMMEELLGQAGDDTPPEEAIRQRLKRIEELMRHTKYRRNPQGAVKASGEAVGGTPAEGDIPDTPERKSKPGTDGGTVSDIYSAFVDEEQGEPADPISPKLGFPTIKWVSVARGTRNLDDNLEDRAASYVNSTQNVLLINEDFRVYTDLVNHFMRLYEGYPGVETTIPTVVKEWYGQQLVEAVLGVLAIRGSAKWNQNLVDRALSEEALTAVVMPRYNLYQQVSRVLGTKLGSLKDRNAIAAEAQAA